MRQNSKQKQSMEVVCVEVFIDQAMITVPMDKLKDRLFYVEVETEDKLFQTEPAQGQNPHWRHKQAITTRSGTIYFKLFEKSTMFNNKNVEVGSVGTKIHNVKKFKFNHMMDLTNKNKETVGTLYTKL